jgi:hypothetical protein
VPQPRASHQSLSWTSAPAHLAPPQIEGHRLSFPQIVKGAPLASELWKKYDAVARHNETRPVSLTRRPFIQPSMTLPAVSQRQALLSEACFAPSAEPVFRDPLMADRRHHRPDSSPENLRRDCVGGART